VVRATYAEVKKKFGGVDPNAAWDETAIGNLCTQVDAELDGRASPSTFGTGTNEIEFANELVYRKITANLRMFDATPYVVWTQDMRDWFNSLLKSTTYDGIKVIKGQDSS